MIPEIWFFYTEPKNLAITVVNRDSAKHLADVLRGHPENWLVRKNKEPKGKPLIECSELMDMEVQDLRELSSAMEMSALAALNHNDSQDSLSMLEESKAAPPSKSPAAVSGILPARAKKHVDRKYPRKEVRLRVIVISDGRSFRTFSKNISQGGIFLEHVIPKDLIGTSCRVIIGSNDLKENIEFSAKIVGDPKNPKALCFTNSKELFLEKLHSWLNQIPIGSQKSAKASSR